MPTVKKTHSFLSDFILGTQDGLVNVLGILLGVTAATTDIKILDTEVRTAERVARLVFERNIAREDPPKDINAWLRAMLYKPEYPALVH